MKKHVIIATGLAVLSTSAFASKARMAALGQDAEFGSFFIEDTRNVFRNAAHINGLTNYAIIEWGESLSAFDRDGEPNAEGGYFASSHGFSYGVYFGSERYNQDNEHGYTGFEIDEFVNEMNQAGDTGDYIQRSNNLDLFLGGDTGALQWGARLTYAKAKAEKQNDTQREADRSSMGLGFGLISGDLSAWLNLGLKDDAEAVKFANGSEDDNFKWEADTAIRVGAAYQMGDMTLFAEYSVQGYEQSEALDPLDAEVVTSELSVLTLGVGHVLNVSSTSRAFVDARLQMLSAEDTYTDKEDDLTAKAESSWTRLPVTLAYETEATSWLTLRGSVTQNFLIGTREDEIVDEDNVLSQNTGGFDKHKKSISNSTVVAAGLTFDFGDIKVDGTIQTVETGDLNFGDNFAGSVSLHYWF